MITACHINQTGYLILDNLAWLHQIGVIKLKKYEKINECSNKFWLASSIFYVARDLYEILNEIETNIDKKRQAQSKRLPSFSNEHKKCNKKLQAAKRVLYVLLSHLRLLFINNPNLMLDTIKNVTDLFLPLASLNYIKLSPGTQGALGLVSSLISLLTVWDSKYKLNP